MSDSEEAFASADEGEEAASKKSAPKTNESSKTATDKKDKEGVGTGGGGGDGKGDAAVAGAKGATKAKGKQQQQNKKRGKGGQQPAKGQEKSKPISKPSTPPTTTATKDTGEESEGAKNLHTSTVARAEGQGKDSTKTTEGTKSTEAAAAAAPSETKAPSQTETKTQTKAMTQSGKVLSVPAADQKQGQKADKAVVEGDTESTKQAGDVRRNLQSDIETPEGQDIPRGQRDHTAAQEEVLDRLGETAKESDGGWGWSSWGSSLLSAASNSVQTFTHQVGDGFSTIIESVESSLGVPDPEEVAKAQNVTEPTPTSEEAPTVTSQPEEEQEKEQKEDGVKQAKDKQEQKEIKPGEDGKKDEVKKEDGAEGGNSWFASWGVTDIAKKVQNTGKSLASKGHTFMSEGFDAVENFAAGGIDVLESIGKKTYSTITEHDPAFRKTRDFLSPRGKKPNLSGVLREARDQAEREAEQEKEMEEARKAHFGTLFDDYQGIAHLEALEMLSNQSEKKVHSLLNSLSSEDLKEIKPTLIAIKEALEVKEDEEENETTTEQDFSSLVSQHLSKLELGTAPDKLNKVHDMVKQWIVDFDSHESHESDSVKEVHQKSIQALAELTAKGVEQFHKAGELVLMERDKDKDCTERAHSLARLTGVLCHEVGNMASKFSDCLNKMADEKETTDEITPLVTNVYLEATNSSTYIQDAFQLLLPVLQQAALEHSILSRQS